MTRIEATCPTCGTVERAPEDFELSVCSFAPASWYAFVCPECTERVQKHADERVVELLIAEGVSPTSWQFPAELLEEHTGAPLTMDDLLDFHLLLASPDWIKSLTAGSTS
jgi:uncharacterized protein YlaI